MGAVPDVVDGKATFAGFRAPAWHMLGETFSEEVTDYREMLRLANMLDQNVRKVPVEVPGIPAERHSTEQVAVVRTSPLTGLDEVVGWASPDYEVRQPEEIFSWAQFGPTEGARWETAGQMNRGSVVFGSIAFEREVVLDPSGAADVTKTYLMVAGSYDGTLANRAGITPVRVVCQNTLNIALGSAKQGFSFKSTKNIRERVGLWQKAVANTHAFMDEFEREAAALYASPMPKATFFEKVVPALHPKPEQDVKGSQVKWDNLVSEIAGVWNGPTVANLDDSAWKAWQVLTERAQWHRRIRAGNIGNFAQAGAGFDNAANAYRAKALDVVRTFA